MQKYRLDLILALELLMLPVFHGNQLKEKCYNYLIN